MVSIEPLKMVICGMVYYCLYHISGVKSGVNIDTG